MSAPYSSSSSPSSADLDLLRKRVVSELDKGRGYAEELLGQLQFRGPFLAAPATAKPDAAVELVQEVMRSFTSAIAVLIEPFGGWSAYQIHSENQKAADQAASAKCKRKKPQGKERRRKMREGETRETIKSDGYAIHDNYSWRKYGEKYINGYTFPREYFKCAYQGCRATKRVQKIQDGNPGLCMVTCHNQHTCKPDDANHEKPDDKNKSCEMVVKEERDTVVEQLSSSNPSMALQFAHVSSHMNRIQTTCPLNSHSDVIASMFQQHEFSDTLSIHASTGVADHAANSMHGFQPSPRGPLDFMLINDFDPELEEAISVFLSSSELENGSNLCF